MPVLKHSTSYWRGMDCLSSPFRIPASLITGIQWWARGMEILGEMKYWRLINPPRNESFGGEKWKLFSFFNVLQTPFWKMMILGLVWALTHYPRFFILIKIRQQPAGSRNKSIVILVLSQIITIGKPLLYTNFWKMIFFDFVLSLSALSLIFHPHENKSATSWH